MVSKSSSHETGSNSVASLPSLEDLDVSVIKSLPPELFSEINDVYGGRLTDLISKNKGKTIYQSGSAASVQEVEGKLLNKDGVRAFDVQIENIEMEEKVGCFKNQKRESLPATSIISNSVVQSEVGELIPSSLSQVDMSILQQLPEELRADIVGGLPAHRRPNCLPESCNIPEEAQEVTASEDSTGFAECTKDYNLWVGNPPCWIHKFKVSECLLLNILAEMFLRSGSSRLLSSTLQCCLSEFRIFSDPINDLGNEDSYTLCELLKQYIHLKLEADIEEIYVCFCLLKRLTSKSKAFKYAYETVLPFLQASVSESYGGQLHLPAM